MHKSVRNSGFTLIELSIVLVIIAFVVGGILVGRDMIRAAETNRFMSDLQALTTAANNFKAKYGALPGDFRSASTVWPTACAGMYGGAANCNGNGNGLVGSVLDQGGGSYSMSTGDPESINFYFHLYLAGMIKGPATGYTKSNGFGGVFWWMADGEYTSSSVSLIPAYHLFGKSVAALPTNPGYSPTTMGTPYPTQNIYFLTKGGISGAQNFRTFPGHDAYQLDAKYDDGVALTGNIRTWQVNTGCFLGAGNYNYNPNEMTSNDNGPTNNGCDMSIWAGF